MMLSFALSQSKYSSDKLSKDVKRGMLKKCEKGQRPGMALVGYMNEPAGLKGEKRILVDPERFDLVRKMWDMLLSGRYTVGEIQKIANKEWRFTTRKYKKVGGRPLAISTMYEIFSNPFYYGEFEWDGKCYKGAHKGMITKEEFDRGQVILGRKGRPRSQKHRFPFTGIIRCGTCGCMVTAEHKLKKLKKARKTRIYTYYHCTRKGKVKCREKSIRAHALEEQIKEILGTITIPENLLKCTIKHLQTINKKVSINKSKQKAYNDCSKRIDNLLQLYISPDNADKSILTDEEFKTQKLSLLKQKEELAEQLKDCDQRQNEWLELTEKTFEFVTYAKYNFEHGTLEDKQKVFQALGPNFLLKDRKLLVELHRPFTVIKKGMEKTKAQKGWIPLISKGNLTWENPKTRPIVEFWSSTSEDVRTKILTWGQPVAILEWGGSL